MAGKRIRVVAGDAGGWDALLPPLCLALDAGCTVEVYLTASSGKKFTDGQLQVDPRMTVQARGTEMSDLIHFLKPATHHLIVVGASQSREGYQAAATALVLSDSIPRLCVEDMYGSSLPMLNLVYGEIECLCVTDELARTMVLQKFPKLKDNVEVTGGPQYDKTIAVKRRWQERRCELREALNTDENHSVFLVAGGLNGTVETLELLDAGIEQSGVTAFAKVIVRVHARASIPDKKETEQYFKATKRTWFTDVDKSVAENSTDLLPGVDFVLSGYSTTNHFGILYGMPGVVYVGTPAFKRDLKAEKGLERPPEVEAGAGWYVQNGADMADVIMALQPDVPLPKVRKLMDAQKRIASYNDGNAAERVWEQMQRLMA